MSILLDKDMLGESSPRLPIEGLPYQVQNIVTTYAKALNCPVEFVVGAAMAAASQAAGSNFYWTRGIHTCYPQFYTALLGDSTANKTSSIREMLKPIQQEDDRLFEEWKSLLMGMSKKEEKSKIPCICHLLNDTTLEAYQLRLADNPNGITNHNDELLSFFGGFTRYKPNSSDEKFYLSSFGNYSSFKRARVGETTNIPHPIVRIIGGIQPDVLQPYFSGSTMLADGMLPRFLWYVVPEDFRFDESGSHTDIQNVEADWNNILNRLLHHQGNVRLVFDNEAQEVYQAYKNGHSKAKNSKTLYGYEAAVCGKLEIYAIIWAMTSRILRYAADNEDTGNTLTILGWDMQHSLKCMDYFQQTAMMVYHIITDGKHLKPVDCIKGLKGLIINQSQFAESIGYSQQYVNRVLKEK